MIEGSEQSAGQNGDVLLNILCTGILNGEQRCS